MIEDGLDASGGSSGRGATDLLLLSPLAADAALCNGIGMPEVAEAWRGTGGSEDGGVTEEGGGWKGLDLDEETSMPSFSCRQKAQMPLPPRATPAAAAAPGG